ncbi:MAG: hypothetical protein LBE91_07015 [Tannerella sp.]|jgi:hypothetical protein|nr:hypothetical protein [Tannerella sp.]
MDTLFVIEQLKQCFTDSEKIFSSLENNIKTYTNGFWGTTLLIEQTPFDFERSNIKRGKKMMKPPKNKANKFFHIQNEEGTVVAIFGYAEHYEYPDIYIFFQRSHEIETIYTFDIQKKMSSVQRNFINRNKIFASILLQKKGNYIAETYYYDELDRLYKIERKHKDEVYFKDTIFFPDHIYSTYFILEYSKEDRLPNKIFWNAPRRESKQIWP